MWLLVTRAGADKDQDPEPWSGVRDWLRLGTWTPRQGHPLRVGPTGEESSLSQLHPLSPPRGSWCPSTVGPVSPNLASMKTLSPRPERARGPLWPPRQLVAIFPLAQPDRVPRTCLWDQEASSSSCSSSGRPSQTSSGIPPAKKHDNKGIPQTHSGTQRFSTCFISALHLAGFGQSWNVC